MQILMLSMLYILGFIVLMFILTAVEAPLIIFVLAGYVYGQLVGAHLSWSTSL